MRISTIAPLAFAALSALGASEPKSGENGMLTVAVDPDTKIITGYFSAHTGFDDPSEGPQFFCTFYFRGVAAGKPPYRIKSWFPGDDPGEGDIPGTIVFSAAGGKTSATIHLEEEHGGCWNVEHFADGAGSVQELDSTGTWRSIRVVAAKRAYFFDTPIATKASRKYVTTGDAVRVYAKQADRVQAEFVNESGVRTTGWIREKDLYSDAAPAG
jgi:hypothetical protein